MPAQGETAEKTRLKKAQAVEAPLGRWGGAL